MTPTGFFQITPKRLSLRRWNFLSFSFYFIDAFWKKIPVTDITASYDDVITKNVGANFTVKTLLNWKIIEILLKSHLRKICTWNFHRMLFIRWVIHYKRKINIFFQILIVFLLFSIVLKQWNNRALIKRQTDFYLLLLDTVTQRTSYKGYFCKFLFSYDF